MNQYFYAAAKENNETEWHVIYFYTRALRDKYVLDNVNKECKAVGIKGITEIIYPEFKLIDDESFICYKIMNGMDMTMHLLAFRLHGVKDYIV